MTNSYVNHEALKKRQDRLAKKAETKTDMPDGKGKLWMDGKEYKDMDDLLFGGMSQAEQDIIFNGNFKRKT